ALGRGYVVAGLGQCASSQANSAASAWLRSRKGPRRGPATGERSAHHCPSSSGSTWLARRIDSAPSTGTAISSPYTQVTVPAGSIRICMGSPVAGGTRPDQPPAGHVGDEALDLPPHHCHLGRHVLAQVVVIAQALGRDAPDQPLGLLDQGV